MKNILSGVVMKKIYLEPILHDNTRIMLSFRPVSVSNMVELSRPIILLHLSAVTCLARAVLRSDGGKRGWRTACRHRMARPSPSRVARLPAAVGRVGWRPWWWWSVGAGTARPRQRERRGVSPPSPSSPTFPLVLVVAFPSLRRLLAPWSIGLLQLLPLPPFHPNWHYRGAHDFRLAHRPPHA